MKNIFKIKN